MEEKTNLRMCDWADADKPREKLLALGKKSLTDAELIAILIGSGSVGESAVDLAKRLLASASNDLNTLRNHGISDLTHFRGMGEAKAITVVAALELGYRLITQQSDKKAVIIHNSRDIYECLAPTLIDLPHEEFWALFLNVRGRLLSRALIARGGTDATSVDLRIVFKKALESGACSLIVAHNHPSGSLDPSPKDRDLTNRIREAGRLMQITLLDHLILGIDDSGQGRYFSFHDEGLL